MSPPEGPPWWAGIAATETSWPCGDSEHRLRWADGRLTAVDHPDVDRERALVALGGARVPCLDLLDAWNTHADDLDLLVLASRGPSDRLPDRQPSEGVRYSGSYNSKSGFSARTTARRRGPGIGYGGGGWTFYQPLNSGFAESDGGGDLSVAQLANLSDGLTDRLVATVIATWTGRIRDGDQRAVPARPKLQAALYGRVLATVRGLDRWSEPLDVVTVGDQAPRSVTTDHSRIHCELPFSWLNDVWARGFAAVLGHLCLGVESAEADGWHLLVVDHDLRGTRTMTISLSEPVP